MCIVYTSLMIAKRVEFFDNLSSETLIVKTISCHYSALQKRKLDYSTAFVIIATFQDSLTIARY